MQAIYGQIIADSLPILRPWLLDGALAPHGLIDRPRAEALLRPEFARGGGPHDGRAVTEAWLRRGESRLRRT